MKIIDVDLDVVVAASVFVVPVFVAAVDSVGFGRNCDASPNANSIVLLPFPRSSSSTSSSEVGRNANLAIFEAKMAICANRHFRLEKGDLLGRDGFMFW